MQTLTFWYVTVTLAFALGVLLGARYAVQPICPKLLTPSPVRYLQTIV